MILGKRVDSRPPHKVVLDRLTVLVLDDNVGAREMVTEVLRGLGVRQIYKTGTCAAALSILQTRDIDLLLVDILLDGEDGLSFLRKLAAMPSKPVEGTRIVVVSSQATEARVIEAGAAGACGFLSKPYSVSGFAKRLSEALNTA